MGNDHQVTDPRDEIILEARYSGAAFWLSQIALLVFGCLVLYASYDYLLRGDYIKVALGLICAPFVLTVTVDQILTREILFYPDRVVKIWRFLGRRTIYYSNGQVKGPPPHLRWLQKAYHIKEVRQKGTNILQRVPILYNTRFFPSETARQVAVIMEFLTDKSEDNPRTFRKTLLPREAISQNHASHCSNGPDPNANR
jgi:hypothetical protein